LVEVSVGSQVVHKSSVSQLLSLLDLHYRSAATFAEETSIVVGEVEGKATFDSLVLVACCAMDWKLWPLNNGLLQTFRYNKHFLVDNLLKTLFIYTDCLLDARITVRTPTLWFYAGKGDDGEMRIVREKCFSMEREQVDSVRRAIHFQNSCIDKALYSLLTYQFRFICLPMSGVHSVYTWASRRWRTNSLIDFILELNSVDDVFFIAGTSEYMNRIRDY
jgi:hypothetical protein